MPISTSEQERPEDRKQAIRDQATALGFDAIGFAAAELPAAAGKALDAFLGTGAHGDMEWMATRAAERRQPSALWREARTVIALAVNYGPVGDPLEAVGIPEAGSISVYARGDDYHEVLKKRLKALARWVSAYLAAEVKVFVDTAPVMEKPIASRAGLGWQGKHTNLVSREFGSWLFLGEIFVAVELPPDGPHADRCGSCRRCLDACPTGALPAPYRLDARRCISYLTIEHKGHIDPALRPLIGNRIYGCDDCLGVCPWNRFAREGREAALAARPELNAPPLEALATLDDEQFRQMFRKSPIKRLGRDRFVRNVLIAIGNGGDSRLAATAVALLDDGSPLVRAMAVWALKRMIAPGRFHELRSSRAPQENDAAVRQEWRDAVLP